MKWTWKALVPSVASVALLALALDARTTRVTAGIASGAGDPLAVSPCTAVQSGDGSSASQFFLGAGDAVIQPIDVSENLSACSLAVAKPSLSRGRVDLVYWDPQALAPDPTTVALRSFYFPATTTPINSTDFPFSPAVVLGVHAGVADPPPSKLAAIYTTETGDPIQVSYVPNDAGGAPPALVRLASGPPTPLTGAHPVLGHLVCAGDGVSPSLEIMQCVNHVDAALDLGGYEFIQKIRLPARTDLHWVEISNVPINAAGYGRVRIFDAEGQATPGLDLGIPILDVGYSPTRFAPEVWTKHWPVPDTPGLYGGRDYWLVVTTGEEFQLRAHTLTGNEGPDFTGGIGALYRRESAGAPATEVSGTVMSFRLVGTPQSTVDVLPARGAALRLAIAPNPARGAAFVTWTGARDDVRFEVLDARGRRVSSGAAGIGASGSWSWSGRGDDGRELPAGIYFVRARDGAGRSAGARVTRIR